MGRTLKDRARYVLDANQMRDSLAFSSLLRKTSA